MFKAQILGRLGRDANICETNKGLQFLTLTLAVNTKQKNVDKTYWVDVVSFNPNHLKLAKYLTKGKLVHVGGDFNSGTITDKVGVVRLTHSILADYINFINIGAQTTTPQTNYNKNSNQTDNIPASIPEVPEVPVNTVNNEDDITMYKPGNVNSIPEPVTVGSGSMRATEDDELPF